MEKLDLLKQGRARSRALARAIDALQSGDAETAARSAEEHVANFPDDPMGLRALGKALVDLGEGPDARACLVKAITLDPNEPGGYFELANSLRIEGMPEQAAKVLTKGLGRSPRSADLAASLAYTLTLLSRHGEALELLDDHLERRPTSQALQSAKALTLGKLERREEAIDLLETILESEPPERLRIEAFFLLAEQLDRLERHDEAFRAAEEANRLNWMDFHAAAHRKSVDAAIEAWTPREVDRLRAGGISDERPLLVVGMPRSGTTLVERMLGAHPDVHAAGEREELRKIAQRLQRPPDPTTLVSSNPASIRPGELLPLAQSYARTLAHLGGGARRVTDKAPLNAMRLGLVAAMLPKARIIHCVRDPEDIAISNYFTYFAGHLPYSSRLEDIALFHADLERLMAHWKRTLDIPIHEVSYEALVQQTEPTARAMLDFAGLPWDDRVLRHHEHVSFVATASHDQVRKPVYTSSVGRAQAYAKRMAPFREAYQTASSDSTPLQA